jgi:Asp-tRNA(Asn)/Glu-tRNA(Gln) amidotransferase A subunit family amidase
MARSARDVRALFEVLAGHDQQDPFSAPVPLRVPDLSGLTVGVMERFPGVPAEPAIPAAVRGAADLLTTAGIAAEEFTPADIEIAPALWRFFFVDLSVCAVRPFLTAETHWTGRELWDPIVGEPEPPAKLVLEKLAARDKMRAALLRQMERYRVLLWPAANITAFPHRKREWRTPERSIGYFEAMFPLVPANLFGLPSIAVPVALSHENLPVSVQFIGRPWDEELLLELAVRFEAARRPLAPPPGY